MTSLETPAPVILVVDDDPTILMITSTSLKMEGYEVLTISDSSQNIAEFVSEKSVNLVLLDCRMPKRDGLAVLKELREVHSRRKLPVLMLSSSDTNPLVVQALNDGANDYISKLVDPSVLIARINSHLQTVTDQREEGFSSHYQLEEVLGKGTMGTVYRAHDKRLDRTVAVKILNSSTSCEEDRERFRREAKALAKFHHPSVVSVYDFGTDPSYHLVMNYVEGQDLAEFMGQPLESAQVLEWMKDLLETMSAVHSYGLIHRDLKPSNIRLTPDGKLIILDFGMAKWSEAQHGSLTSPGTILGTPRYLAPEELDCNLGETDQRTDVYTLGVIAYQMLTGQTPFEGSLSKLFFSIVCTPPVVPSLNGAKDSSLDAIVLKALEKDPSQRYQSANEMLEALKQPF